MAKGSAGLLLYRELPNGLEVLLVHPGGPFWAKKDDGAWSIPKGEFDEGEDPLEEAKREFEEETGAVPTGEVMALNPVRQPSGKVIHAWAMKADFDTATLVSNTFQMEWPPKSGRQQEFPEVDRAEWLSIQDALRKIVKGQAPLIHELHAKMGGPETGPSGGGDSTSRAQQGSLFEQDR